MAIPYIVILLYLSHINVAFELLFPLCAAKEFVLISWISVNVNSSQIPVVLVTFKFWTCLWYESLVNAQIWWKWCLRRRRGKSIRRVAFSDVGIWRQWQIIYDPLSFFALFSRETFQETLHQRGTILKILSLSLQIHNFPLRKLLGLLSVFKVFKLPYLSGR